MEDFRVLLKQQQETPDLSTRKEEAAKAMGKWMVDYLEDAGYHDWDTQATFIKQMMIGAFPPIDELNGKKIDYAAISPEEYENLSIKFLGVLDEHIHGNKQLIKTHQSMTRSFGAFLRRVFRAQASKGRKTFQSATERSLLIEAQLLPPALDCTYEVATGPSQCFENVQEMVVLVAVCVRIPRVCGRVNVRISVRSHLPVGARLWWTGLRWVPVQLDVLRHVKVELFQRTALSGAGGVLEP
eukprot:4159655-Prymnesium_polylepis.1